MLWVAGIEAAVVLKIVVPKVAVVKEVEPEVVGPKVVL